jgi:uncharacterized protein (TIGR02466 family)
MDFDLKDGVVVSYGTPMLRRVVDDAATLNEGLKRIVLEKEQAHPELGGGARRFSSQGGWQSDSDLLQWPHTEIATLRAEFNASIDRLMQLAVADDPDRRVQSEISAVSWANVNRDGSYNVIHNHPGNHWSGVYYVSIGEPDPSVEWNGAIEFYDPRGSATAMPVPGFNFGFSNAVTPEPGMMIVFPSWLMHAVHPYRGPGVRISIALNASITNMRIDE